MKKTATKKLKSYKEKPLRQKSFYEFDKQKNLVIHSVKIYSSETRDDVIKLDKSLQRQVKAIKKDDVKSLRQLLYSLTRVNALNIDSKAEKLNLCKHARARQHCFNVTAKALDRSDLIVEYAKAKETETATTTKAKVKTAKKKTAKR